MGTSSNNSDSDNPRLSYRFQRVREAIRNAILSGKFADRLPGQRELSRRFKANPKTIAKALSDLSGEGLLDGIVGKGTFIRGAAVPHAATGPWLLLAEDPAIELINALRAHNPDLQLTSVSPALRAGFLNQFTAVLIASPINKTLLHRLILRNVRVILLTDEPAVYSTSSVVADDSLGTLRLGRRLLFAGHRRFAVIAASSTSPIIESLQQAATNVGCDLIIDICGCDEIPKLVDKGTTAVVFTSSADATRGVDTLKDLQVEIRPGRPITIGAVGCIGDSVPCSGYFVRYETIAQQVNAMLCDVQRRRPVACWLAGEFFDAGTIFPEPVRATDA